MASEIAEAVVSNSFEEARELLARAFTSGRLQELTLINHPLGFFQMKFGPEAFGHLKLHAWLPGRSVAQDPPWDIHRHRWSLTSMVLAGAITNETFRVDDDQLGDSALYDVKFRNGESILVRTEERVHLGGASAVDVQPGFTYKIPDTDFHRSVVPEAEPSMTLVVTSPPTRQYPSVVGDIEGMEQYRYERSIVRDDDRSDVLEVLNGALFG